MSWLFSRALVEAFSEDTCSDGALSALSSGSPTPQAYLPPDRMTAFSRPSRFGMTFSPLTADRGEALLTSYLAAFRARTSASQAREPASTVPAAECGDTWRGSLARFDPDTSSWKTAQRSLLEDSRESLVTWPRSGMTADGQCWELPTLERRTSGTGSGCVPNGETFWHTPNTNGLDGGSNSRKALQKRHWPTPTASAMPCEGTQRIMRKKWLAGELSLEEASAIAGRDVRKAQGKVPEMWPTPTVCGNYNRKGASATSGDGLATAVMKCATPTARDWKSGKASDATMERNSRPLSEQIGGSLNPTWVEWLMGWPLGWTDLKPLATDKSPCVQPQHGTS